MNIFQKIWLKMKIGTTNYNEIDQKWSNLKKFLGEKHDINGKITESQDAIREVLELRYGKNTKSWPKNKGLVMMYEALIGETELSKKLEILRTGKGVGHFSDWDNELKEYFNNIIQMTEKITSSDKRVNEGYIVPTTEETMFSDKKLDDEVQDICKMIKNDENGTTHWNKIEVCDLVFSRQSFFKYNFDIDECKKMINNSKGRDDLFSKADNFGKTFYVDKERISENLESKFKNNDKTNEKNNTSHANAKPVQCALLLIGLDKKGSNFEECFKQYQVLFDRIREVYRVRSFRTSDIIATVVFFQRKGVDNEYVFP